MELSKDEIIPSVLVFSDDRVRDLNAPFSGIKEKNFSFFLRSVLVLETKSHQEGLESASAEAAARVWPESCLSTTVSEPWVDPSLCREPSIRGFSFWRGFSRDTTSRGRDELAAWRSFKFKAERWFFEVDPVAWCSEKDPDAKGNWGGLEEPDAGDEGGKLWRSAFRWGWLFLGHRVADAGGQGPSSVRSWVRELNDRERTFVKRLVKFLNFCGYEIYLGADFYL